jgi:hypothetical protein
MLYFQTKNPDLGKFWRTLELKMLVYFMTVWNIFGNLVGIMYGFGILFPFLVCLGHEKSGRPVSYQLFLFFFAIILSHFFLWAYLKGLTLPKDLRQRGTFGGP